MGQSTPTTTMAFGTFESRYREFRDELHPKEQVWFDRLLESARRHSNAINRRPHLDFERPVMLAMMMEEARKQEELRTELRVVRRQLDDVRRALEETGALSRKVRHTFLEIAPQGQVRLRCVGV